MELTLIISGGILLGCLIALSWFAGSDAPYVPTKKERIKKILKLSGLKRKDKFWELGSGDGRVVLEAAKMGAKAYGVEQSLLRILFSRWQTYQQNLKNAHFIHGNIFHLSHAVINEISNADLVFIFLLPKGVSKLEPILRNNLKKGARVITQTFHFKHWRPIEKILITDKNNPNTLLGENKYEGDFWIYRV